MTKELLMLLITSFVGGGLSTPLFQWLTSRKTAEIEVKKKEADNDISVGEAWQRYAEKMEKRLSDSEAKHERIIQELRQENLSLRQKISELEQKYSGLQNQINHA